MCAGWRAEGTGSTVTKRSGLREATVIPLLETQPKARGNEEETLQLLSHPIFYQCPPLAHPPGRSWQGNQVDAGQKDGALCLLGRAENRPEDLGFNQDGPAHSYTLSIARV